MQNGFFSVPIDEMTEKCRDITIEGSAETRSDKEHVEGHKPPRF
jgi:hypothetical protein